jgi:hypothetical protein
MTVAIPSTYSTTDINSEGGVLFGIPVQSTAFTTLAANHNFCAASYVPPVGMYMNLANSGKGSGTRATSGSDFHNIVAIPVENQVDGRGLTCQLKVSNSSSSLALEVRMQCGTVTGSAVSVAAGAVNATVTLTVSSVPTGSPFAAVIQCNNGGETANEVVKVSSAIWMWTPLSGTIADSVTASGIVFAHAGDHANTEPLTVEQFNRYRGLPRVAFDAMPQSAASYVASLYTNYGVTSSSFSFAGFLPILKRRNNLSVKFRILARGHSVRIAVPGKSTGESATNYDVACGISSGTSVTTVAASGLTLAASASIDLSEHPNLIVCPVYIKNNSGAADNAQLYSIEAVIQ